MVTTPTCPDHGRLVLDLALGRLDDPAAERAEAIRCSCPCCAAWWSDNLEGEQGLTVEREVAAVFARFAAPRRRHLAPWLAAAAAALLALGGLLVMRGAGPTQLPGDLASSRAEQSQLPSGTGEPLFANGLESGNMAGWVLVGNGPTPSGAADKPSTVFANGLEAGDLSGWSS